MKKKLHLVKLGGNIIENPEELEEFLIDFSKIDAPKILIHGGGKLATKLAERLGIKQNMIDGRRITDAETLEIITMVYGGLISKKIVASLAAHNNQALGLSGADLNCMTAVRRPVNPIDYGYVGDPQKVDSKVLGDLLNSGFVPVFSALSHDGKGQLLNTNADTMASVIASALSDGYDCFLYYCFEKKGVLKDIKDDNSVLSEINLATYQKMRSENQVYAGMIPKIDTAFEAVKNGVKEVFILKAEDLLSVIKSNVKNGTKISL